MATCEGAAGPVGTWYEVLWAVYGVAVMTGVLPYDTTGHGSSLGPREVRPSP